MTSIPARHPKGIPAGGQFAAAQHSEPGFSLKTIPREALPSREPWTEKRIQAASLARHQAAERLERELSAAGAALTMKQRDADQEFFDWDTDFAVGTLSGRYRRRYLKDREVLRQMFSEGPEYRYNREYTHKKLAPFRESAQVLINKALNTIGDKTGSDNEWFIRL